MTTTTPFHRLARTDRHRWWRPLLGSLLIIIGLPVALAGLFGAAAAVVHAVDGPADFLTAGPLAELVVTTVVLGMLTPLCLLAAAWVQRRPAGTLSSVAGRLRWGRLGRFLLLAAPVVALMTGVTMLLPGENTTFVAFDGSQLALGLAVVLLLVPLQAAGEEYLFRGWILQSFGAWFASPWPGIVVSSLLFGLAHGIGSAWLLADVIVFGLLTAVLTVRTGGLEAAIALHVANNVAGFGLALATGTLDDTGTPSATVALVSMASMTLYTLTVLFVTTPKTRTRLRSRLADGIDFLIAAL
ncbi:CPBP family intramembrane glutamic endopeptidase [Actinoplanes derwentensis]|uniref:Membrane protease YdiL, CAAX protease family n=1 Tax=Actinoplanes derwentensis TaxID=113562 RepID=A0A1H2A8B8_9ACTN|nr:CPBP family intramembrane glutamic endopeptidase [Actinoplanes derwentensis]GID88462.1 hypothetical protein Ade03nite_73860 [Actinoplanes derwentensis]SDT42231.1 Membrane protease YdiL, CAAX protease family [Actinoplanes derwentensis]